MKKYLLLMFAAAAALCMSDIAESRPSGGGSYHAPRASAPRVSAPRVSAPRTNVHRVNKPAMKPVGGKPFVAKPVHKPMGGKPIVSTPVGGKPIVGKAFAGRNYGPSFHAGRSAGLPRNFAQNPGHVVGRWGGAHGHRPFVYRRGPVFYHRYYYPWYGAIGLTTGALLGWYWYDTAVPVDEYSIYTDQSLPVCDADSDSCVE